MSRKEGKESSCYHANSFVYGYADMPKQLMNDFLRHSSSHNTAIRRDRVLYGIVPARQRSVDSVSCRIVVSNRVA